METEDIGLRVKVGAVFEKCGIIPKWFVWNGKKIDISNVTHSWKGREGEAVIIYFSAAGEKNLYELSFNQKTLEWRLEKVCLD